MSATYDRVFGRLKTNNSYFGHAERNIANIIALKKATKEIKAELKKAKGGKIT